MANSSIGSVETIGIIGARGGSGVFRLIHRSHSLMINVDKGCHSRPEKLLLNDFHAVSYLFLDGQLRHANPSKHVCALFLAKLVENVLIRLQHAVGKGHHCGM